MQKKLLIFILGWAIISCKLPTSDRQHYSSDPAQLYKIHLNPTPNSTYQYNITNETTISLEADGKEIENTNRSVVDATYKINKDSAGNFLYTVTYDKIHIRNQKGDEVVDADANAVAITPLEKMLAMLKQATIVSTVDSNGLITSVTGYEELGNKLIETLNSPDPSAKKTAYAQFEKVVGDGIVKQNMEQFFMFFPDSAIQVGDSWKISSRPKGEIPMSLRTTYTLKSIDNDIAVITADGKLKNNEDGGTVMGYSNATAELDGTQEGELQVETKTGMLRSLKLVSKVKGTIQVMGREVPMSVTSSILLDGKKK